MLFTIHRGNVANYSDGQAEIAHLVFSAERIVERGLPFTFTDGHAEIAYSKFFVDLKDLNHVDMQLMSARYWNDTQEDGDRKRRRQAEFLVHNFLPWDLIEGIGIHGAEKEPEVRRQIGNAAYVPPIAVTKHWYY
jgi:hypothetical protein